MIDTTLSLFERDVIEASMEVPVLVNFWAPWCGPSRTLGPLLERLEREYGGRFRLVNVNSDINSELVSSFDLKSIPYAVAFVDGNAVAQFMGAQPEAYVRVFLDRLIPNPGDMEHRGAREAIARGDFDGALAHLRNALALDPANDGARLDMVGFLLDGGEVDRARSYFSLLSSRASQQSTYSAVRARVESAIIAQALPELRLLEERVGLDSTDLKARLALAEHHIAARDFRPALEQLLEIVRIDRKYRDDIGRIKMLDVFEMAAGEPGLVSEFRGRLSSTLF